MKSRYSSDLTTSTTPLTIADMMSKQTGLIEVEARKLTDRFCERTDYVHETTCSYCFEIGPKELSSLFVNVREKYGGAQKFLQSPKATRKEKRKLMKKARKLVEMVNQASCGGLICLHYFQSGENQRERGLIFTHEYGAALPFKLTESKKPTVVERPIIFSLRCMISHSYGNLDEKEEGFFNENCRQRLGIPKDVPIGIINLSQIKKNK